MSLSINYHHRIDNFESFGHAFAESASFIPYGLLTALLDVHHGMGFATRFTPVV